jgi:dTDP-4-dehydrorhamnose 3,5-epimerase
MKLTRLPIVDAWRVELEPSADERGFFARCFCREEFAAHGIAFEIAQCSVSLNRAERTLRGLHYQAPPYPEAKLVRCTGGRVWDCIVDLRPDSATYLRWFGEELSAANRLALLIPPLCAHGFITLAPDAEMLYAMDAPYAPGCARAVRWNDPAFAIDWPLEPLVVSEADRSIPDFAGARRPAGGLP